MEKQYDAKYEELLEAARSLQDKLDTAGFNNENVLTRVQGFVEEAREYDSLVKANLPAIEATIRMFIDSMKLSVYCDRDDDWVYEIPPLMLEDDDPTENAFETAISKKLGLGSVRIPLRSLFPDLMREADTKRNKLKYLGNAKCYAYNIAELIGGEAGITEEEAYQFIKEGLMVKVQKS